MTLWPNMERKAISHKYDRGREITQQSLCECLKSTRLNTVVLSITAICVQTQQRSVKIITINGHPMWVLNFAVFISIQYDQILHS